MEAVTIEQIRNIAQSLAEAKRERRLAEVSLSLADSRLRRAKGRVDELLAALTNALESYADLDTP